MRGHRMESIGCYDIEVVESDGLLRCGDEVCFFVQIWNCVSVLVVMLVELVVASLRIVGDDGCSL